jgi:hypothetical protein
VSRRSKIASAVLARKSSPDDVTFEVKVTKDYADQFEKMLEAMQKTAGVGHSFSIILDPEGDEQKFGMDGDGSDHITEIKRH